MWKNRAKTGNVKNKLVYIAYLSVYIYNLHFLYCKKRLFERVSLIWLHVVRIDVKQLCPLLKRVVREYICAHTHAPTSLLLPLHENSRLGAAVLPSRYYSLPKCHRCERWVCRLSLWVEGWRTDGMAIADHLTFYVSGQHRQQHSPLSAMMLRTRHCFSTTTALPLFCHCTLPPPWSAIVGL